MQGTSSEDVRAEGEDSSNNSGYRSRDIAKYFQKYENSVELCCTRMGYKISISNGLAVS